MRWLGLVVVTGCAVSPDLADGESSVVLGDNQMIRVAPDAANVPARYRSVLDAIGRSRPNYCTVTHLGNGIAITAGHCFAQQGRNKPCTSQSGDAINIDWGVRGGDDASGYMTSRCMRILASEFHEQQTDYAIIEVSPAPAARAPFTFTRPSAATKLTIFSHPNRRPLVWSQICERGRQVSPSVFAHDCDTDKGSSGAAVFVDSSFVIAGVHNGGHPGEYNYGTYLADTPLAEFVSGGAPSGPVPDPTTHPTGGTDDDLSTGERFGETLAAGETLDLGPYTVAAGHSLTITTEGVGDVDLYARRGAPPVGTSFDCGSAGPGANESCTIQGPASVYAQVLGYAPSSSFDLLVQ
ncbi:MAG TPA: pre-peptidase C-terminal domain-containing protein [Kofleriaceae bacterium]|nr:pre-peptidase C-terminal domain-containing protein [Kofleriaceae bacterium]